jgi:hypothetical protein
MIGSIFAQLMNLNNHHLTQLAETSNPFYPFHSVSKQSPDSMHQSMPSSLEKVCIRWILNRLRLSRRVHKVTSRTDSLLANLNLPNRPFQLSEFFCSQTTPKLAHSGRIEKPARLRVPLTPPSGLQLHFTKAHPLDVPMQALNNLLIRMITKMLQYMQPHHKANLLTSTPLSTLIRQQSIDEIVPINVTSEKKKFVILPEGS